MSRYGAVDIGSNSIRMQIAEASSGNPHHILVEDRLVTRLGEGVFRNGELSADAAALVYDFLGRTGKEFEKQKVIGTRAVATAAVRDAYNQEDFLARATDALGAPVEVISGQEEARLIHNGVQSQWPHPKDTTLIIDIGGRAHV